MNVYEMLVRAGASGGCHQRPERSFFIRGRQFPLCARCTGILAGQILGVAAFAAGLRTAWWMDLLCIAPLALDGITQSKGWRASNNPLRLITGLLAGGAEVLLLCKFILWLAKL